MNIDTTSIDRMIQSVEREAVKTGNTLRLLHQLREITQPTIKLVPGKNGPGFIATIVPAMRGRGGRMHVKQMLEELHRVPEYKHVSRESLEATLSGEMRRAQSRLVRIAPGTYALLESQDQVLKPKAA